MMRNKERQKAWREANRERLCAYHREYYLQYYQTNKERILEKNKANQREKKAWQHLTPEQREHKREYDRMYYHEHRKGIVKKTLTPDKMERKNERQENVSARRSTVQPQVSMAPTLLPAATSTIVPTIELPKHKPVYSDSPTMRSLEHLLLQNKQLQKDIQAKVDAHNSIFDNWDY